MVVGLESGCWAAPVGNEGEELEWEGALLRLKCAWVCECVCMGVQAVMSFSRHHWKPESYMLLLFFPCYNFFFQSKRFLVSAIFTS